MENKKVLIAYATRYGTTTETAKEIANFLKEQGIETTLLDLKQTKEKNWPPIDNFNGVIVSSGINCSKWMGEPEKFLKKNKAKFTTQGIILGAFVSCGFTVTDPERAKNDYLVKKLDSLGIKAQICEPLGPIFDFSATSKMGGVTKAGLKAWLKSDFEPHGIKFDYEGRNDFRVVDQIRNFANQFAKLVKT